jgi:3-phenylpropionate/trans-cinnamate dioxygenase ferredoxin subunit
MSGPPRRLISLADLDESGVTVVEDPQRGALAVGVSRGQPFAVSNRCRHLRASLGDGRVAEDGCIECPWHKARYDVQTGRMTRGPGGVLGGAFGSIGRVVKETAGRVALATYPVEVRDGEIWLT